MEYVFLLVWWFSWEMVGDDEIKTEVFSTNEQCLAAKQHIKKGICADKFPMMMCEVKCLKKKITKPKE